MRIFTSLSSSAPDDIATKSSFYKTGSISRTHKATSCWATILTASIRQRFWIPRIRNLVKVVLYQCLTCYRSKAQAAQQLMGELPSAQVQPSRSFLIDGIDYAGPISLPLGNTRSKTITKGYIAIFVCSVTKTVHMDVVTSLTTEAFLAALRCFNARQGKPKTIYSVMMAPISKVHQTNYMKYTICFNLLHE